MRNIRSIESNGVSVGEVLQEFNERADEFGLTDESQIISVQSGPPTSTVKIHQPKGPAAEPKVLVTIFYWSDK